MIYDRCGHSPNGSAALNSFNGFHITDTALLLVPRADGTNLIGNAVLPNPSVLTIEIGDITLDIKAGDLVIGNATLTGFTLKPGTNVHPMTGILDLGTVLSNLDTVLKSQSSLLKTGDLTLNTVTTSVVYDGVEVPYYTEVMSQLTLVAHVPVLSTLKNTFAHVNLTQLDNYVNSTGGLLDSIEAGGSGSSKRSSALASALKRNVHVRDAFGDTHPVKRDAMLDSLAGLYHRL